METSTWQWEGSVSTGTLRSEDLIPCFLGVLDDIKEDRSFGHSGELSKDDYGRLDDALGAMEIRMHSDDYFSSDESDYDLSWLFDELDAIAPEGWHFGAHEGDGADYGFWRTDDN